MTAELPFNVDCWNTGDKDAPRILTHFHRDHIPCVMPTEIVVPFEVKYADEYSEHRYNTLGNGFKNTKNPFKTREVGKIPHLNTHVPVLGIEFNEKEVIVVGDYDPPATDSIVKMVKDNKPDILVLPTYAKKVSAKKGRLLEKPTSLSEAQDYIIREVKKFREVLGKPEIITMAHSEKAKEGLGDSHITYEQRVPSLQDYQLGVAGCDKYGFCKKCKRRRPNSVGD